MVSRDLNTRGFRVAVDVAHLACPVEDSLAPLLGRLQRGDIGLQAEDVSLHGYHGGLQLLDWRRGCHRIPLLLTGSG